MATYTPNVPDATPVRPGYDDELFQLRPLIDTLLRWWQEIVLLTLVAAIFGAGLVLLMRSWDDPRYKASAVVTVARIVSNVNLDDSFQTQVNSISSTPDSNARRTSLLGLVANGSIAAAVLEELGPELEGISPTALLNTVDASFVGDSVSDLIQISVTADTPEKAAAIANAWANHYVEHVNSLYGEMPAEITGLVETELEQAQLNHEAAQHAYEQFLAENEIATLSRLIAEKKHLINTLQDSRQAGLGRVITQTLEYQHNIVATYLEAMQQNRLLAFVEEQKANRALVQELIGAISQNRQLAFSMDQKARVELFTQYAELELQNRLLAMQQEQNTKSQLFKAYNEADLRAKLTVFNEQVNGKVGTLIETYATKRRIEQLLDEAKALQTQIAEAGEAGASSNTLPLLLLKLDAYAATATESGEELSNLQLNLTGTDGLNTDINSQATDVATLIDTLTERIAELEGRIEQQSQSLFNNEGYQLLDGERPADDELYAAIQKQYMDLFEVDALAAAESVVASESVLSKAIIAKYDELFGLGSLTNASLIISSTTPIYVALESQYPSLFAVGELAGLGNQLADSSALDAASQEKINEALQPLDNLEGYLAATEADAEPILRLEEELKGLESTLERQRAQRDTLLQRRDMALEAYTTLNNKLLELTLQRTAANREVRLASAANPPDGPVPGRSVLIVGAAFGVAGFFLAVLIAFLASYLNAEPFLSRLYRPHPVAPAGQLRG